MKSALQPFFPPSTEDGEVVIHHRVSQDQEDLRQRIERLREAMTCACDCLKIGATKTALEVLELNL